MKADELETGDYFYSQDAGKATIVGRRIDDGLYWFDVDSTGQYTDFSIKVEHWRNPVHIIDFQTFLTMLIEQCAQQNQPVEEINKENIIQVSELNPGQFFIDLDDDVIGRRFNKPDNIIVYWTKTRYCSMDEFDNMSPKSVVPVTLPQAVLFQLETHEKIKC